MQSIFKKLITSLLAYLFLTCQWGLGQSLPIAIDGSFGDWTSEATTFSDTQGDAPNGIDLLNLGISNDADYLFLRVELGEETLLTDFNDLTLFLDTDGNPLTGKILSGIGAELELNLGDREGRFYIGNSSDYIYLSDVGFRHLPTVSSEIFEMAIWRGAEPDGDTPLFTSNTIKLLLRDGVSGDYLPNAGNTLEYTFDVGGNFPFAPMDLSKNSPGHLRLMTWNMLSDGILDFDREPHFRNVVSVLQPDIVTFNEAWDATVGQAVSFMNQAAPLGNFQSWQGVKLDAGNITLSRFPILENWLVYPGHRLTASLIDVPESMSGVDFLVINAHLRCCEANYERQQEADAFAKFILDLKSPGGAITLPEGTPFALSGDLNLVGWRQQLTTLLTGDIQNTATFGAGGALDWDGTDLADIVGLQSDRRMAHTWESESSQYPPSRLDFLICSNSVLDVVKSFTLNTTAMSSERLATYGLGADDTYLASDHHPKVTDFDLKNLTAVGETSAGALELGVAPNPVDSDGPVRIFWQNAKAGEVSVRVQDASGREVFTLSAEQSAGQQQQILDTTGWPSGIYFIQLTSGGLTAAVRVVK